MRPRSFANLGFGTTAVRFSAAPLPIEQEKSGEGARRKIRDGGKRMKNQFSKDHQSSRLDQVSWEFRLVLAVTFVACLLLAALRRGWTQARRQRRLEASDKHCSVLGEAKSMANTYAPFAFMG